jgi:two-component system, NtrC family, sensor kinase
MNRQPRKAKRPGLYTSIIIVVTGFSIVFFLAFALVFFTMSSETNKITIQQCGIRVATIVRQTLHNSMAHTNPSELKKMMMEIRRTPGIESINLYNHDGYVIHSTDSIISQKKIEIQEKPCLFCHQNQQSPTSKETFHFDVVKTYDNHRKLIVTNSILNEPGCSAAPCHYHSPEKQMLGLIEVQIPLKELDRVQFESEVRFFLLAILITVGLIFTFIRFLGKRIKEPLAKLTKASERVAAGDMALRLTVTENDLPDIYQVAYAFNKMLDELQTANRELKNWSRELEIRVKERTERLKGAQNELIHVERMASLGKLSASVAHEINNPLAGVLTYTKLVLRSIRDKEYDPAKRENLVKYLEMVESETKRCGNIVKGLLDFSRDDVKQFQAKSLNQVINETANLMRHPMKVADIEFEVKTEAEKDTILCNPNEIKQMCIAILVNAQEAIKDHGNIEMRTDNPEPGYVRISIQDNGVGIAEEDKAHIFEPFFTRKLEASGVGLGLAVVYGLVQQHKGKISLDSTVGLGTTFHITFPLTEEQNNAS